MVHMHGCGKVIADAAHLGRLPRVGGHEVFVGREAGDVFGDGAGFRQDAVIGDQCRDAALGVEREVVGLGLLAVGEVERDGGMVHAGLLQKQARGDGDGAGGIVEFHGGGPLDIGAGMGPVGAVEMRRGVEAGHHQRVVHVAEAMHRGIVDLQHDTGHGGIVEVERVTQGHADDAAGGDQEGAARVGALLGQHLGDAGGEGVEAFGQKT